MKTDHKALAAKLPCDENAERLILGVLIMGHERSGEMYESLAAEDFNDSRHQVIYKTMRSMWERNLPVELPMLHGAMNSSKEIGAAGGVAYLSSLIDGLPFRTKPLPYIASVKAKRVLREAMLLSESFLEMAKEADRTGGAANELVDGMLEKLAGLGKMVESEDRGKTYRDAADSLLFKLEDEHQVRINTGLPTVDATTGGFRAGELVVLAADSGVGKSFFALQIGRQACGDGHHIQYASGEMIAEHLMGRVLSSASGVEYWKIRRPEGLEKEDRKNLITQAQAQCKACRILDGELSLARIRMAARSMASNHELGAVIVDYDELVEVRGRDEWEQQRILVRSLKSLAMELGVPVVMVSQLRKSLDPKDQKKPTLQRLYGSGSKAKHASLVLYVDRPYVRDLQGDEAEAKVFILKSRDGRLGVTPCKFNVRTLRFEE